MDIIQLKLESGRVLTIDFDNPSSVSAHSTFSGEIIKALQENLTIQNKKRLNQIHNGSSKRSHCSNS